MSKIDKKFAHIPKVGETLTRDQFNLEYPNYDKMLVEHYDNDNLPYRTWSTVSKDGKKILFYHDQGNSWCYISFILDFEEVYPDEEK